MTTRTPTGPTVLRVVSTVPGRLRLRADGLGRSRGPLVLLESVAIRLAGDRLVREVAVIADARSIVVRYDPHIAVETMLATIERATRDRRWMPTDGGQTDGRRPSATDERPGFDRSELRYPSRHQQLAPSSNGHRRRPNTKHQTPNTEYRIPNTEHQTPDTEHRTPTIRILHAAPGRLRLCAPGVSGRPDLADRVRDELRRDESVRDVAIDHYDAIVVRYDPASVPDADMANRVADAISRHVDGSPPQSELIRIDAMAPEQPRGVKALILPTAALALAATEVVPAAVISAALAVAAIPVLQRAARGLSQRQVTVDELDATNIALLALRGNFVAAAYVSWLLSLGEVIRGEAVRRTRTAVHAVAAAPTSGLPALGRAPVSNAPVQEEANALAARAAAPLYGLGLGALALSRDPRTFVEVIKPRYDVASAIRFGLPAAAACAIAACGRRRCFVQSAEVLDRMAGVGAIVDAEGILCAHHTTAFMKRLTAELEAQGTEYALPLSAPGLTGSVPALCSLAGERPSRLLAGWQSEIVAGLHARGRRFALISSCNDSDVRRLLGDGDVLACTEAPADLEVTTDLIMPPEALLDLSTVLGYARAARRIQRQNLAASAGAAVLNLAGALSGITPPGTGTTVNTLSLLGQAANSLRPLRWPNRNVNPTRADTRHAARFRRADPRREETRQ